MLNIRSYFVNLIYSVPAARAQAVTDSSMNSKKINVLDETIDDSTLPTTENTFFLLTSVLSSKGHLKDRVMALA